ncbi:PAS domain-containing sensor histidine kinase [Parachryseolinea silvisoli]|jgi:PAS domain S-box-containing protein|uniref:PAS domain-containing sensor histidine kinase n=1 Tax=Parachryseolinea silvisoli TaxID=2873601 RepID=UPI002265C527|nr:PAS domain-containing sensor histidine kinase [Parachryseolinea silvisoli]MCD9014759.1 PAS domain-containing sensor histidine kinase [Parachryseolinea silvisoli]
MDWRDGFFRELVEHSEDIHIVADKGLIIRYVSSSVAKILGIEPVSLMGRNIREFIQREKFENLTTHLREGTGKFTHEFMLPGADAQMVYFDVSASQLLDRQEFTGVIFKLNDITEKKLREDQLIRSNRQLDQVIYKTTHDLKAPVMSALGLVKIAEMVPDGEKDQYIGMIKKSLLRLDSFIEEMNDFYRNEKLAVQREKVSIEQLLLEEWDNLKNLYPDNAVDVFWDIHEDCEWHSDRLRVKTVVTNILSNAIKYMDLQKQNRFIKIAARVTEEFCDISFEDNGIGIDPLYQEKIFDLFFRATDRSQGTGLGLFIVKDTLERLGGEVKVVSNQGQGTTFHVRIPNQIHQSVEIG